MHDARNVAYMVQTATPVTTYGHDVSASGNSRGEAFGALIRDGRRRKGWTQDRLVAETGVSRSTITRWEQNNADRPDPDHVRAVCLALDLDPRRAAVALGYLTADEIEPPGAPRRPLDPEEEEVVAILQDPGIPSSKKAEWVEYLRFLRDQRRNQSKTAG